MATQKATKKKSAISKSNRTTLDDIPLSTGKKARLHRLMVEHGPGNGTIMVLPIDQGLEHGPRDFFENPDSLSPDYQLNLAVEGHYSAIAYQIGLAQKYIHRRAGQVPLILKLNGKTELPPDDEAFSPVTASVEDAVRLGADAVGYTLYVGSPSQDRDFIQFNQVRRDAEKFGMPVIVWAYPRGSAVNAKGGQLSIYAVDYAARVACELGADIVKLNIPKVDPETQKKTPKPYDTLRLNMEQAMRKIVSSAGRTLVLVSGGSKVSDAELYERTKTCMKAGVTGFIFGRNMWQRKYPDALRSTAKMQEIMKSF